MLSLQTVNKSLFQFRGYTKLSDHAHGHLLWVFNDHIKNSLGEGASYDKIAEISYRAFNYSWGEHPYEKSQLEVKKVIAHSVADTMQKIVTTPVRQGKGIMYEEQFFQYVLKEEDFYVMHDLLARNGSFKREYPCFHTGRTICHLIKKDEVSGSDAIHSALEGPTAADCGSTIEIVFYKAILDLLGEKKFNKLWDSSNKLEIDQYVSCHGNNSSLAPFLEYPYPNIDEINDEKTLDVGDHVMVTGVPWYTIKHPNGPMSNSHAVVVGLNAKKEALIHGLGVSAGVPYTLGDVKELLVLFSNEPQSEDALSFIEKFYGSEYPTEKVLQKHRKKEPYFKPFDSSHIFKYTTVKEANAYGGCLVRNGNITRISSYVLAVLRDAPDHVDLRHYLMTAKAEVVARQLFENKQAFEDFLAKHNESRD